MYIIGFILLSYTDYQKLKISFENAHASFSISNINVNLQIPFKQAICFACFRNCVRKVLKEYKKLAAKYANIRIRN